MPLDTKIVPEELKEIQPHPYQVWNFDEIGFDPNGSWLRVVCTYKLFTGRYIWKYQTGERSPFWCTDLIFTIAYVQFFVPPVIIQQAENYTQDHLQNLLSDWIVHNTTSGYMVSNGWMKAMIIFSRTCGASKLNPQILLFDFQNIHFDDRSTHLLQYHHIYPFILNADESYQQLSK